MMKRNLLILALVFFLSVLFMPADALAMTGFIELFTTDAFGSTIPKSIFGPEETPYLYMSLQIPDGAIASTVSAWNSPDNLAYFSSSALGTDTERWVTLSDWDDIKKTGKWTINANYFDSFGNNDVASATFTVTPEPATISLLFIGGIPMLLRRKHRHAKNI